MCILTLLYIYHTLSVNEPQPCLSPSLVKSPHSWEPVNRVKTPPQRGISRLGDHGSSIFVASASEWKRVSVRGQTEEYTRGEGSDRVVLHLGEKNSKQPEVQTPRVIPKDCPRCGHGQEIALVSSRHAVTTLRNNENSVRLVWQRAHAPIYGFFSGIYGNR